MHLILLALQTRLLNHAIAAVLTVEAQSSARVCIWFKSELQIHGSNYRLCFKKATSRKKKVSCERTTENVYNLLKLKRTHCRGSPLPKIVSSFAYYIVWTPCHGIDYYKSLINNTVYPLRTMIPFSNE